MKKFIEFLKENPVDLIIVVVGLLGVLILFVKKNNGGQQPTITPSTLPAVTSQSDQNSVVPLVAPQPSIVLVQQPATDLHLTTVPPSTSNITSYTKGVIRDKNHLNNDYDEKHPEGVPLDRTPGDSTTLITRVPFGAMVDITGPTLLNPKSQNTVVYPVSYNGQTGYITAWDFKHVS